MARTCVFSIVVFMCLSVVGNLYGQHKPSFQMPELNKPFPAVIIRNIANYSNRNASVSEFKGRWLVIDFWTKYCSVCVEEFPKTNQIQVEFKDKVQILMVGLEDQEGQIKNLYERFKKKQHLTMLYSFDSLLFKRLDIGPTPHLFIIDPDGILRGISNNLDGSEMAEFLHGNTPHLSKMDGEPDEKSVYYRSHYRPFVIESDSVANSNTLYQAVISKWHHPMTRSLDDVRRQVEYYSKIDFWGSELSGLYRLAFFGQYGIINWRDSAYGEIYPFPVIEAIDSLPFVNDFGKDIGIFSMSIVLPKGSSSDQYQRAMCRELQNCFGYRANMEVRLMPYWKLIVISDPKAEHLKSLGGTTYIDSRRDGFRLKNAPIFEIIKEMYGYSYMSSLPSILDETGINYKIDLTIDALMSDFDDVRKDLRRNGLDLVLGKKRMKVLVIRD